jgi:nitrile hydratase
MAEEGIMHDHDHALNSQRSALSDPDARVRALETILTQKGYIAPEVLDRIVERFETQVGPHVGAKIIARAWCQPEFHRKFLEDGSEAVNDTGEWGRVQYQLVALQNTAQRHNLIVCTLCSCYPFEILGLPPSWYKSQAYRSRAVIEPRAVLRELGLELSPEVEIRVFDSTADTRYLVIPTRPAGTDGWSEQRLAALVTRDSMVGAARAKAPAELAHE